MIRKRRSTRSRSILWRLRRPLFVTALVVVGGLSVAGYAVSQIPLPEEDPLLETTFVCASDVLEDCNRENSLAQLSGDQDRVNVTYDQLPPVLVDAVIAAEDRDYFEHSGVDPIGILRAAWANFREQDVVQGGSSITQQYVKNAFLTDERTVQRKVKEAVLAVKLEQELPKEEILLRYLNTIYFGRGSYGVQAASRTYFGKDVEGLTLPEAAYLAGLIRAPESADARRAEDDPRAASELAEAEKRRRYVLDAMLDEQLITPDEHAAALDTPFEEYVQPRTDATNFGDVRGSDIGTEYFVEYVRRFLRREAGFSDAEIFGGGLRVYTTLDYDLQRAAYEAVTGTLDQPDDPAGALTAVDDNGRVMAMVGGRDWDDSKVNLAVGSEGGGTGRQPGSSFKPFVLATALEEGISVQSMFESDSSVVIPGADGGSPWEVSNYEYSSHGAIDLIEATRVSSNTVYAQLMDEVGPAKVTELAQRTGITSELAPVHALVLGAGEVSVLDMASAYSTFIREGQRVDPLVVTRVEDAAGNVLASYGPQREQVLDPLTGQTVSWVLSQVMQDGTGSGAAISQPAGGKTGTTEEYRDAWFAGFTCKLTAAVWVGYDEAEPDGSPKLMTEVRGGPVTGGSLPADIWQAFMQEAAGRYESCPIPQPYTFGGEMLNPELVTTTTTSTSSTTSPDATTTEPEESTTTTEAPEGTTTTEPPPDTTVPPSTEPPASTSSTSTPPSSTPEEGATGGSVESVPPG